MLLMGDEVRRTQQGNNNAYCQDNEISWFNWNLLEKHADIHRFAKRFIDLRLHPERNEEDLEGLALNQIIERLQIQFHGVRLDRLGWDDGDHSLALTVLDDENKPLCHLIFNAYKEPLEFELPPLEDDSLGWFRWLDTNLEAPDDLSSWAEAQKVTGSTYQVESHSVVGLIARGSREHRQR